MDAWELNYLISNAVWAWCLRHAAWLISRFAVVRGATPHELALADATLMNYASLVNWSMHM